MSRDKYAPWQPAPLDGIERFPCLRDKITRAAQNGEYAVLFSTEATAWGSVEHLWIRNLKSTDIPWREKQRIKDELVGKERVAIEVFPARSDLVDSANMYHLWVLPDGMTLPFTLDKGGGS